MSDEKPTASTQDVEPRPTPDVKTERRKLADHPHWWTLALSLVAIVISVFSYTESHRTRLLNEQLGRPIVRVISVTESGPIQTYREKTLITNRLTLKNSGRSFAKNVRIEFRAQLDDMRVGNSFRKFSDTEDAMSIDRRLGDLAPEDEDYVPFMANVLSNPPTTKLGSVEFPLVGLKAMGTLTYEDPLSGETYTESFCYVLRVGNEFSRC